MGESEAQERAPFFRGKLLTPEDLELTQQYFRERFKRHNRSLHGFGIVSGLNVTVNSGQIAVEPGLALDCEGKSRSRRKTPIAATDISGRAGLPAGNLMR